MTKTVRKLVDLRDRFERLSMADQLVVIVGVLNEGKTDIAEALILNLADNLRAARLMRDRKPSAERSSR